ncbi:MAG: transporter, family [Acidobacteriales bacterium]|nr:transporter, family [Terriglobales bacterium]
MSNSEFGSLSLVLVVLLGTAHFLGYLFARLRQPRVIGEILAGVLLGPSVLAHIAPNSTVAVALAGASSNISDSHQAALGFLYNLGLLLLMFVSGAETKNLFNNEDRRELTWLGLVGTGLPFIIALAVSPLMPRASLMGPAHQSTSLLLVIGIAVAVTSIPVISRILRDLGILHTRFARLILGVAVCEDIFLWAVLALAVSLAKDGSVPAHMIAIHTAQTLVYLGLGLFVMPKVLAAINRSKWNPFIAGSPIAYVCLILLGYSAIAATLDVSLVFAAFLAGFALAKSSDGFQSAFETVGKTAFAIFIPIYFALVGSKLDLSRAFSYQMLLWFLTFACVVKLISAGLGSRFAGFSWRDSLNLSIALNARGGPGIVLASVALEAGIINRNFYTTLVIVALLTSQLAGAWLDFVLRKGWPLLSAVDAAEAEINPHRVPELQNVA